MIWGRISQVERTDLKVIDGNLNAARYRDEIIAPIVLPFLRRHRFSHVFQHDNARCHVARVSMDFLNDNHIRTLPWPALSPDLKLIKHLWDELGRRVRNGLNPPKTLDELRRALIQEWNNIPQTFIRNLIGSTLSIMVITKLPNSEQSYKGKVKTHNYINRQNQSTTGKL